MSGEPRRSLRFELALVLVVSVLVLAPGIGSYSLVDPWETHYGEVARMMLQDHDYVHTQWPQDGEGFRSKPVLTFWMMAGGLKAVGVAADGGYSGELVDGGLTMIGIRLPFVLSAVAGLALMWCMLARLVNRRLAWLALLVVGSCPFYCLVARQAIPDMPLVACTMGALSLFALAVEDGERPIARLFALRLGARWRVDVDARHAVLALAGGFVAVQAVYYAAYFTASPGLAVPTRMPPPALWLPLFMAGGLALLWAPAWIVLLPVRYVLRAVVFPLAWANGGGWEETDAIAERLVRVQPITTMRQVYLLGCYSLLGVSVLAKGPPGLAVVGATGVLYVVALGRWRALYEGAFELKRGVVLMIITFLPWHVAMYLKDGPEFINQYLYIHILNRAAVGVDNSPGTFEYYAAQLGHGMWLWAALLPAALPATLLRARVTTREGRVRVIVALWAIGGTAFFALVQTKFHHYILPVVPALGILVAWFLDDILVGRARLHALYAALAAGIALLVCRDLMHQPERWIEMFVFRYDRPWPNGPPYSVDPSDGFLALGLCGAGALALLATPWRRLGVAAVGIVGLAICVWSLQAYMPVAGQHWGMREAIRTYYEQRQIYGEEIVYRGERQLWDEWHAHGDLETIETFVPIALQIGQPMAVRLVVGQGDDDTAAREYVLAGAVSAIGEHRVTIALAPGQRAKLDPVLAVGARAPRGSQRPPVHVVDADRLIAWQLYWRGENFWSGDEIVGPIPELRTAFVQTDNVQWGKYWKEPRRTHAGRRYFLVTEASRIQAVKPMLPTDRAKETYEVLDTTSNKFSLAAFWL